MLGAQQSARAFYQTDQQLAAVYAALHFFLLPRTLIFRISVSFSALTLLVGRQETHHPACKILIESMFAVGAQ